MNVLADHLLNGLTLGAFYALVTAGLALIFGVARLVNFAHGDFFTVGGYLLFSLLAVDKINLPYPVLVLLVTLAMVIFGIIFERLVAHPVIEKPWSVHMVATMGSSIIISNALLLIFTSDPKHTPTIFARSYLDFLGMRTSYQRLIVLAVALLVFLALQWFLRRTTWGKAMRAVSQNRETCVVVGIDIRRVSMITFAISSGLAGLAGVLLAPLYTVMPSMGALVTLKGLAAVVLGGMGHLNGSLLAAFLIGMVESFFGGYVPAGFAYKDVATFTLMMLVLVFKPQGLFGKKIGL
jgi:branched-chain amino acid transport system permease protein